MILLKFGGSSVATPKRIQSVFHICKNAVDNGCRGVVFSAFGGVTDDLIQAAKEASSGSESYLKLLGDIQNRHIEAVRELISVPNQSNTIGQVKIMLNDLEDVLQGIQLIKELTPRTLDFIMSFGERLSNFIISRYFQDCGLACDYLDTRNLVVTNYTFGNASWDKAETAKRIKNHFETNNKLQIITGFIGSTPDGITTTLGRGGSDFTASIFASALNTDELQIWTDVSGVMTADPRKVRKAFPVEQITYDEAQELSHFGAKVIYPPTMQPAMQSNIPIRIKNTFDPDAPGTLITHQPESSGLPIKGISSISHVALIQVQGSGMVGVVGIAQRIFGSLAKGDVNTIMISQGSSEHSVCFAVAPEQSLYAKKLLEEEFELEQAAGKISEITVDDQMCVVAVVGERMKMTPGIAGKIFQSLGRNGINISAIAQGSSELNISIVINRENEQKALIAIHDAFFLSGLKSMNLFFIGAGLIGGTLLRILDEQREKLARDLKVDLRLVGICNSRKMLFDLNGIEPNSWKQSLEERGGEMSLDAYIEQVITLNLPNSIVVDCTSSETVADQYTSILGKSISIVTPNKKACSGTLDEYRLLLDTAKRKNALFLYETNVGAGLPIIKTLEDMYHTGDEIDSIQGVLSGTLSYLFNEFDGSVPFSELVKSAREQGYTEPDPRDDLNGMDVARKLLILARESGFPIEFDQIDMDLFLPKEYFTDESVDSFLKRLSELDGHFDALYKKAESEGKKLRFIASADHKNARIALEQVDASHPCYNLQSTDNIILIKSRCYNNRPMVVSGPGAGPEVTASGVLADIIKAARS